MSVTIPSGVHEDAGARGGHSRDRAEELVAAVVYLAAAKNTYGTLPYRRALRRVGDAWPQAVVMDADGCGFASRADWHLRWPFIRDGIDCLVVLAEDDGTISHDTWLELRDASDAEVPCWIVTADADLVPVTVVSFRLYPTGARTDRRWARAEVSPGA
ncbi:MAG TPA: hypothetical protein VMV22_11315 [Acidimicrobiales bacterium]|nr:hypothetical protein [Acidimicrobiales bacterium]